ncbi:MAG TPA: hypothetical protein VFF65_06630, partial [Phycisphaerales bacterium]|nr:hypothetical protein [Phycisphaerales bacterium]
AKHSSTYGFDAPTNAKNLTDYNPNFQDTGSISSIGPNDFTNGNYGANTFRRMIGEGINSTAFTTAAIHPARRKGDNTPGDPATDLIGDDFAGVSWSAGRKASQFPVYPRRSGATIDTEVVKPPLRPADLLMPWAVGPYQNPTATVTGTTAEAQLEARHTTLSEAIAQGMNYSRATNTASYEFQIGKVLDRCHLPTDRFVPFNDVDNDGAWTYNTGGPDPMIANGVPFALNILDRFRTTRYGSTTSVMAGTVNINTAPLTAHRMLPFLTPPSANVNGNDQFGLKGHWMNSDSSALALKIKDEAGTVTNKPLWRSGGTDRWDVAAALVAYRDKQAVVVRGDQDHEADNNRVYVDFSPLNDGNAVTDARYRGARPFMTNVVNSRTEPGFKSIGEVMLAIVQDNTVRAGGQNLDAEHLKQLGIDRAEALDNTNAPSNFQVPVTQIVGNTAPTALGVTQGTGPAREQAIGWTSQAYIKPATVGPGNHFVHGGKSSDYDRKVGIANALMNCISTRSDLFCAYFVVHGYTEADVQGLEPWTGNGAAPDEDRYNRPMTPSVQRRYMMVLDRSQCTRPGDKPKVLMFEELPVK